MLYSIIELARSHNLYDSLRECSLVAAGIVGVYGWFVLGRVERRMMGVKIGGEKKDRE